MHQDDVDLQNKVVFNERLRYASALGKSIILIGYRIQ